RYVLAAVGAARLERGLAREVGVSGRFASLCLTASIASNGYADHSRPRSGGERAPPDSSGEERPFDGGGSARDLEGGDSQGAPARTQPRDTHSSAIRQARRRRTRYSAPRTGAGATDLRMIILDTNVVSELMRPQPIELVLR